MKTILLYILSIFIIPHYVAFRVSKRKFELVDDINVMNQKSHFNASMLVSLTYHLLVNKYYRNVFYKRLGRWSNFLFFYLPSQSTFDPCCSQIGGGIYCAHPFSTILNAKSIGKNFSCRNNTTIGNKRDGGKAIPIIGNNVTLGANVCIIGDIVIGNNVIVGAGSVVVKSVPDNCIVAGNAAYIIRRIETHKQ